MSPKDFIAYWQTTSQEDFDTAETLFEAKHYQQALFFCQLALEKLLKGLVYAKTGGHALPIHNLNKLADQAALNLNQQQEEAFKEITSWNIEARYDNIKRTFYHKATKAFTAGWMKKTKELFIWIKNQY